MSICFTGKQFISSKPAAKPQPEKGEEDAEGKVVKKKKKKGLTEKDLDYEEMFDDDEDEDYLQDDDEGDDDEHLSEDGKKMK